MDERVLAAEPILAKGEVGNGVDRNLLAVDHVPRQKN
jgi:hypothetical protein